MNLITTYELTIFFQYINQEVLHLKEMLLFLSNGNLESKINGKSITTSAQPKR